MTSDADEQQPSPFDPGFSRVYPDSNLRRCVLPASDPRPWRLLQTKPRQELRAQEWLKLWGLETFLPMEPQKRGPALVLFPSYIFCRYPDSLHDRIVYTRGVKRVVSFGGAPAVIDQVIIEELAWRMRGNSNGNGAQNGAARPKHEQLQPGQRVLIESGPFKNLIGVFEQDLPGRERVRILLDTVSFASRIDCDRAEVRKL